MFAPLKLLSKTTVLIPMAGPDPGGDVEESVQEADAELFRRARKK